MRIKLLMKVSIIIKNIFQTLSDIYVFTNFNFHNII